MKILALTKYDSLGASSRMRILQYIPYLKSCGIKIHVQHLFENSYVELLQSNQRSILSIIKAYIKRCWILLTSKRYDLIWIEKEAFPWLPYFLEIFFLPKSVPYIVDYDDAVFHWYDESKNFFIKFFLKNKHSHLIQDAELIIVGNEYLKTYCQEAGAKHIEYLPTAIDFKKYENINHQKNFQNDLPIIGWVGQQSTSYNLLSLEDIFLKLVHGRKASLSLVGIDGKMFNFPVHAIPWTEMDEVSNISKFDIGIMPLEDGPFERGKCGYKLIQYMSCGIPVIGSGVGENKNIIDHGVNGFIANSISEWMDYLLLLINDPKLREEMGREGREKILNEYRTYITAPKLVKFFNDLAEVRR